MTDIKEESSISIEALHSHSKGDERLYGRRRAHPLRERQQRLLSYYLPRLKFPISLSETPCSAFGRAPKQIWLEIGFGGGEHSLAQHKANPEIGYIACEVFENGICSLLSSLADSTSNEMEASIPDMLRVWNEDARILIKKLPSESIDRLFLMFPDPWPKARHAKRRFVNADRLPLLAHILKRKAYWHIASDDPTYQEWVKQVMSDQPYFEKILETTTKPQDWPNTRYEQKAIRAGRTPIYWIFQKK